jgi:hypothetical protein
MLARMNRLQDYQLLPGSPLMCDFERTQHHRWCKCSLAMISHLAHVWVVLKALHRRGLTQKSHAATEVLKDWLHDLDLWLNCDVHRVWVEHIAQVSGGSAGSIRRWHSCFGGIGEKP